LQEKRENFTKACATVPETVSTPYIRMFLQMSPSSKP